LARYLRSWASAFSLSADITDLSTTADAGMALLDAAAIADSMHSDDPRLKALSAAGLFESAPDGQAIFVETVDVRAAIRRPIASGPQDGPAILTLLVNTAALREPPSGG
jgi:hypothetical protein